MGIRSEEEYERKLERLNEICRAEKDTPEGEELDRLVDELLDYEECEYRGLWESPEGDEDNYWLAIFILMFFGVVAIIAIAIAFFG